MRTLAEVEEAKKLMMEARDWSVMKWLREKKKVRKAADRANELLDELKKEVKGCWSDELKAAYQELSKPGKGTQGKIDPQLRLLAKRVKQAEDEAYRARMDAEETFDEAERELSTSMAREGCRKAIQQWELDEKAIGLAESAIRSTNQTK
jgi:hypothetical protein